MAFAGVLEYCTILSTKVLPCTRSTHMYVPVNCLGPFLAGRNFGFSDPHNLKKKDMGVGKNARNNVSPTPIGTLPRFESEFYFISDVVGKSSPGHPCRPNLISYPGSLRWMKARGDSKFIPSTCTFIAVQRVDNNNKNNKNIISVLVHHHSCFCACLWNLCFAVGANPPATKTGFARQSWLV